MHFQMAELVLTVEATMAMDALEADPEFVFLGSERKAEGMPGIKVLFSFSFFFFCFT